MSAPWTALLDRPYSVWSTLAKNYIDETGKRYSRGFRVTSQSDSMARATAENMIKSSQAVFVFPGRVVGDHFWVLGKNGIWKEVVRTKRNKTEV